MHGHPHLLSHIDTVPGVEGNNHGFGSGGITFLRHAFNRNEDIGFGEIGGDTLEGDGVRDHLELPGRSGFPFKMADEIHEISLRERVVFHIFPVHQHHAPTSCEATVPVIQPINRRVVLIVTANGHHKKLIGFQWY